MNYNNQKLISSLISQGCILSCFIIFEVGPVQKDNTNVQLAESVPIQFLVPSMML